MYYNVKYNGKKKWILLLHCICSNMHIFDGYIEEVSKKYNIVLVDLPGHGLSKDSKINIDFKEVAEEIIKKIDELNIEKISIWGISLGGVVAKYILKIAPERIEKIVFEGPALALSNKFYAGLFNIFNTIKVIFPKTIYLKAFIYVVIPGKKSKHVRKTMYESLKETDYTKVSKWLTELGKEYKHNDFSLLNKSKVQKVYLFGEKDYIFKTGGIKNINNNKYNKIIIKKGCGHLCHLETELHL